MVVRVNRYDRVIMGRKPLFHITGIAAKITAVALTLNDVSLVFLFHFDSNEKSPGSFHSRGFNIYEPVKRQDSDWLPSADSNHGHGG